MKVEIEVAVPFCHHDAEMVVRLMDWIQDLGGAKDFDAVLIPSNLCTRLSIQEVMDSVDRTFRRVRLSPCQFTDAPWPVGPNLLFAWASRVITGPFLWIEPDCVPTRRTWLHEIRDAYSKCKKPIMAHWYDASHTSGIAVYHPAAARELSRAGDKRQAWDSRTPELFRSLSENTPLIQHFWGQKDRPPKFVKKTNGEPYTATLRMLKTETALFHRCKDGSLIDLLKERLELYPKLRNEGPLPTRAYVQLGRYGDIVNILPVMRVEAKKRGKPAMVVSREFASVLDGVSYVHPFPVDLGPFDLKEGIAKANEVFPEVVVSQVYGTGCKNEQTDGHYNLQSWRQAGAGLAWMSRDYPLVFDRRDYARERALIDSIIAPSKKPVVLVSLRGGFSSRFNEADRMMEMLAQEWGERVSFVDIASLQCVRIFDLIGLMELANGIITTDTSTLHLAAATETPVIALLSSHGRWRQTHAFCRTHASFPCNEWRKNWDEVQSTIEDWISGKPAVIHAFEHHPGIGVREIKAQSTWEKLDWKRVPYGPYARDAREIGDARDLPFLKDVLRAGLHSARIGDIVVFTNSDIELAQETDAMVRSAMRTLVMATCRRMDYGSGIPEERGPGRDLIAFRASWLSRNIDSIPDFVLGASTWDWWACLMARRLVGIGGDEASCHQKHMPECELDYSKLRHSRHSAAWMKNTSSPSELRNRRLFDDWIKSEF